MDSSEAVPSTSLSGWESLPRELLDLILEKLIVLPDYIRFGAVCKSWLSVTLDQRQRRLNASDLNEPPMLLIPTRDPQSPKRRCLYSVTERKIYDCRLHVPFTERCSGSSHGWLAIAPDELTITLINPFSGETINLPPLRAEFAGEGYVEPCVCNVILSDDPCLNPHDYEVVAIYSELRKLAIIRSGEQSWTDLGDGDFRPFNDVIYYKAQLDAVDNYNELVTISVSRSSSNSNSSSNSVSSVEVYVETIVPPSFGHSSEAYLVQSSKGDLLLLRVYFKELPGRERWGMPAFKVYKLMMIHPSEGKQAEWVEIEDLGDDALLASEFPNCHPNSIYYTNGCLQCVKGMGTGSFVFHDMSIFNWADGSFVSRDQNDMPPVAWVVPKLR